MTFQKKTMHNSCFAFHDLANSFKSLEFCFATTLEKHSFKREALCNIYPIITIVSILRNNPSTTSHFSLSYQGCQISNVTYSVLLKLMAVGQYSGFCWLDPKPMASNETGVSTHNAAAKVTI